MTANTSVFIVQEAHTRRWVATCCDVRCAHENPWGEGTHTLTNTAARSRAEAAATRHRRYLRTLPAPDAKPRPDECETCGQSPRAVAELQQLVAELEARLARHEKEPTR